MGVINRRRTYNATGSKYNGQLGVFILDVNNRIYTSDEWKTSNNNKAVGVAVLTDDVKFVIAPNELEKKRFYSDYIVPVPNIANYTTTDAAKTDYNGLSNTEKIVAAYDSNPIYVAGACSSFIFKNGYKGYLPSIGELWVAYQNKTEIDICMNRIKGDVISENYWSSTNRYNVAGSYVSFWVFSWLNGELYDDMTISSIPSRPFAKFPES